MFHELVRRGYEVRIGRVKEKEVDFVCQKGDERKYFQVCYMMGSEETREREFSALLGINDQYPKVILSLDRINFSNGGIIHKKILLLAKVNAIFIFVYLVKADFILID